MIEGTTNRGGEMIRDEIRDERGLRLRRFLYQAVILECAWEWACKIYVCMCLCVCMCTYVCVSVVLIYLSYRLVSRKCVHIVLF